MLIDLTRRRRPGVARHKFAARRWVERELKFPE
jgi:hypothetical protein